MIYNGSEIKTVQIKDIVYYNRQLRAKGFLSPSDMAVQTEIDTFISDLAENRIIFDKENIRLSYKLCETLIREGGRDQNGIYSDVARNAMAQVCFKQNILPSARPLIDRKISFRQKIKNKFISFAQKYIFKQEDNTPKKDKLRAISVHLNTDSTQGTVRQTKPQSHSLIAKIWDKSRYAAVSTVLLLSSLSFNSGQTKTLTSIEPLKQPTSKKIQTQKMQKILEHKTYYMNSVKQAHENLIWNNLYDVKVEMQLGKAGKRKLYHQIQSQIDNHVLTLDADISLQHFAYALTMSRIYEPNSVLQDAMKAQSPLSSAQQKAIKAHILEIGHDAVSLSKKYGTSRHSKWDSAPKNLKQKFIQAKRATRGLYQ